MTAPLYQLTGELLAIRNDLMDAGFDDTTIEDTLEGCAEDFDKKAVGCALISRELAANAKMIRDAAAELVERARKIEARAENLEGYLQRNMKTAQRLRIENPLVTIALREGRDESVEIENGIEIPERFTRVKYEANKTEMKKALKAGEQIPGVRLVLKDRLEIRV
jgi:hypothetical protein